MPNDKAKNIGKFIIIMLCFAVIFFLLLPFLEDSSAAAKAGRSKKAAPQIFTSNPLTELAREIYSLFSPRHQLARGAVTYTHGENRDAPFFWPQNYESGFVTADAHHTFTRTDGKNAPAENTGSFSISFPESPDLGPDAFDSANGEWVLVRQVPPDASQRGMHDINMSDTPYDRFVRLERASRYGVKTVKEEKQIPDSKLARFFQPINQLLGIEKAEIPAEANTPSAFRLASAPGATQNGAPRRPTERFMQRPDLNMPADFSSSGADGGSNQIAFDLLNPFTGVEESVANLKEAAAKTLTPEQQNSFNKYIDQQKAQTYQNIRQQVVNRLEEDAEEQEPKELVSITRTCGGGSSGFYKQRNDLCPDFPLIPDKEQRQELNDEAKANQQQSREMIDAKISELTGTKYQSQKPTDMLVLLSKTKAGENPLELLPEEDAEEENSQESQLFREFYNYMYEQQGCDQQDCYWIGAEYQPDPSLRHTIQSAGMEYLSDPLKIHYRMFSDFQKYKIQNMEEGESADSLTSENIFDKNTVYYVPYTKENMDEINQRNNPMAAGGTPQKPQDPFVVYVPSAANVLDASEVLPHPYWVIYDDEQSLILDQYNTLPHKENESATLRSPKERGEQIRDLYIKRLEYGSELNKEMKKEIETRGAVELLRLSADNMKEQLRQTSADQSLDSRMGL